MQLRPAAYPCQAVLVTSEGKQRYLDIVQRLSAPFEVVVGHQTNEYENKGKGGLQYYGTTTTSRLLATRAVIFLLARVLSGRLPSFGLFTVPSRLQLSSHLLTWICCQAQRITSIISRLQGTTWRATSDCHGSNNLARCKPSFSPGNYPQRRGTEWTQTSARRAYCDSPPTTCSFRARHASVLHASISHSSHLGSQRSCYCAEVARNTRIAS